MTLSIQERIKLRQQNGKKGIEAALKERAAEAVTQPPEAQEALKKTASEVVGEPVQEDVEEEQAKAEKKAKKTKKKSSDELNEALIGLVEALTKLANKYAG